MALRKLVPLHPKTLETGEIISATGVYAEHHEVVACISGGLNLPEEGRFTNVVVRSWRDKAAKDAGLDHLFENTVTAPGLPNLAAHRPAIKTGDDETTQRAKDLQGFATWAHVVALSDPKFVGAEVIQ